MRIVVKPMGIIIVLLIWGVLIFAFLPRKHGKSETAPPTNASQPAGTSTTTKVDYREGEATALFDENGKAPANKEGAAQIKAGATWVQGQSGSALHVDRSKNQFVDFQKAALDTSKSFTVTCWVNMQDAGGYQTFVSQDGKEISAFFLQRNDINGRFAFTFHGEDSTHAPNPGALTAEGGYRASSQKAPVAGVWYQLAGVYDIDGSAVRLYVNGELEDTIPLAPTVRLWKSDGNTIVGAGKWGGNRVDYANATIDNVHLYQRVLTEKEIKDSYESKN